MKFRYLHAVLVPLLVGCPHGEMPATPKDATKSKLQTTRIDMSTIEREIRFDGTVEAVNQVTVAAQTTGRVIDLPFDIGDFVEKNAVICRITAITQKAQARAAAANVLAATAQLQEAEKRFSRVKDLVANRLMAQAEFDRARADLDSAVASANAAQEALTQAQEGADHTEIRAPFSGYIANRLVDVGETVTIGTPLLTGLSLQQLRTVVKVPQQHIAAVRRYHRARVILADGSSVATGTLRIPPAADGNSHAFHVQVTLPDNMPAGVKTNLFPGTFVKVAFVSGDERRLLLPATSVVMRAELTAAYVVNGNGQVSLRYVRVGAPVSDGRIPVLSGIVAGDHVALDPLAAGRLYRRRADAGAMLPHD